MSDAAVDDLDRARLDWPESALIDLISEHYQAAPTPQDSIAAARAHVRFLHELIEGEPRRSAFLRLELIACCTPRGLGMETIETADHAAFRELTNIVEARFRNSTRMRLHFVERLEEAAGRLPTRSPPSREPATIRVLSTARPYAVRALPRIGRRLAANG